MGKVNYNTNKDWNYCYYFYCEDKDRDATHEYFTRLTVDIDGKTFYFFVVQMHYDGILTWNDEPNEHYPFVDNWDGPEEITNTYYCFNHVSSGEFIPDKFRQSAFLDLDELKDYVNKGFVETYKDIQFKW